MAGLLFPKPRPAKLERTDKRRQRQTADERENTKVRARSGGRCEVAVHYVVRGKWIGGKRCERRAVHIHHRLGGWGRRARGPSILAENKFHVCPPCHTDIHARVLVPRADGTFERRS